MQPFDIGIFQQGSNMVNEMLLKRLRGPNCHGDISVEVEQFKAKHMKRRQCTKCMEWRDQSKEFSQTTKHNGARRGRYQCVWCDEAHGPLERKQHEVQSAQCTAMSCQRVHTEVEWVALRGESAWMNRIARPLVCDICKVADTLMCYACSQRKQRNDFDSEDRRTRCQDSKSSTCKSCKANGKPAPKGRKRKNAEH